MAMTFIFRTTQGKHKVASTVFTFHNMFEPSLVSSFEFVPVLDLAGHQECLPHWAGQQRIHV